ncbi:MATE family efflux transporter [Gallaecimonas mangrovi]|uniref:MATE family efflux transporter n=1 Tax=Gallaecimonas mangrovi TaxID=2291597 RepID=UPI001D00DFF0|nr:MATE family efflux transporter [Gallaecimonas mangrovi]
MQDLTRGPISRHILAMALPITLSMVVQTLYLMVDLYFVARLGSEALAGVNAASNIMMLVVALTQMLSVGTVALVAKTVGAKDQQGANLVFNQSLLLAIIFCALTLLTGYAIADAYINALAADAPSRAAGLTYMHWYLPALSLVFINSTLGSALRGTGIVKPTMVVQVITVLCNMFLTPVMTAGWLTGYPMGVVGAALSTTVSVAIGVVIMGWYFMRLEHTVHIKFSLMKPHWPSWKKIFNIGLPSGGEFLMMFLSTAISYWLIKGFGHEAQAAYGVGSRLLQLFFMPALAVSLALPAIVGQNLGAGNGPRIKEALNKTLAIEIALMLIVMLLCRWQPAALAQIFSSNAEVVDFAKQFLHIIAFVFIASAVNFTCSSFFQGMGNTWPALFSSMARLILYAVGALVISRHPGFALASLWHWYVAVGFMQALLSYVLVRRELAKKLPALTPVTVSH